MISLIGHLENGTMNLRCRRQCFVLLWGVLTEKETERVFRNVESNLYIALHVVTWRCRERNRYSGVESYLCNLWNYAIHQ